MILVALATLGAAAVAFVLYPVFADGDAGKVSRPGEGELELIQLEEKKARLYEAITDLDFEKDAGKVSAADYETARNDYLAQVSAVLARLDELSPKKAKGKKAATPAGEGESRSHPKRCDACRERLPAAARFCPGCGTKVS